MTNSSPIDLAKTPCVFDKLLEPVMGFVQEQHKQVSQHPNQKLDYTTAASHGERTRGLAASGQTTLITAYGITSRTEKQASPQTVLHKVRGHWSVEVSHYIIDWVFDEDRSTIRTGFGPENMTRLRRFAIGLIKSKEIKGVSKKMRQLNKKTRAVLDYLKITNNRTKPCVA